MTDQAQERTRRDVIRGALDECVVPLRQMGNVGDRVGFVAEHIEAAIARWEHGLDTRESAMTRACS